MKYKKTIGLFFIILLAAGCSKSSSDDSGNSEQEEHVSFVSSFDYQPEIPKNGKLLGIIELGYSGFNSYIVKIDPQDRWSLEKAVYSDSHVAEGAITLDHVLSRIEAFKSEMLDFGVKKNNINLVASSSAFKNKKVKKIASQLRNVNIGLISVNIEQEGNYALYATIPKEFTDKSFLIDIGSGSTIVSWVSENKVTSIETYGSKYYLQGMSDDLAQEGIKAAINQVPQKNKTLCFVVGRAPYVLATATNNRTGRYTILEHPDRYQLRGEHELAGLNLYKAIWDEETFSYVFDWDSNFAIGVLMSVN